MADTPEKTTPPVAPKVAPEPSKDIAPQIPDDKGGSKLLKDIFNTARDFSVDPVKRKASKSRRRASAKSSKPGVPKIFDVEEAADALLIAGKEIDIKDDGKVKITLDTAKLPRKPSGDALGFEDIVPPGVKGFKFEVKSPDGSKSGSVAYRNPSKSGDFGFYYKDKTGKEIPLKLKIGGDLDITISPDDYEDISPKELDAILKKHAALAAKKGMEKARAVARKAGSSHAADIAGDLVPASPRRSSSGRRSSSRSSRPSRRASASSASPQAGRRASYSAPARSPRRSSGSGDFSPGAPVEVNRSVDGDVETVKIGKYKVEVTRDRDSKEIIKIDCGSRVLEGPVLADAMEIWKTMRPNEPFVNVPDPIRSGRKIVLRESVYKLYLKANELAMKDGYAISCGSTWRSRKTQAGIHARSSNPGVMTAAPGTSHHHRGATVDAKAYYYAPGASNHLKPLSKKKSYAVLKKYLPMVGFVNYKVEGWHHELFNPRWAAMMIAAKYLPDGTNPESFVHPRILNRSQLAYVDNPPRLHLA
jgi:hypothetical protein